MKIFFLSLMFSPDALEKIYGETKCGVHMATHIFCDNLLSGFEQTGCDVENINIPPTGSFPMHNKKLFSKGCKWGKDYIQPGFINLPYIKHKIQVGKIVRLLDRKISAHGNPADCAVVCYTVYEPFLDALRIIKKKYPEIKICLIQTDPIKGRGEREKFMTPAAVKEGNRLVNKAKICDCFVLLTKYLSDVIETGNRSFAVLECICNGKQQKAKDGQGKNVCLYTGSLNEAYGLKELVEAIILRDDCELRIAGNGDLRDYVTEISEKYQNVKYLGYLDRDGVAREQDSCDFLINPRRPSGTYTLYSFPSKTAEYMMTGKPVIMYKLEGVPDEYDGYLNYLSSDEPKEISVELGKIFGTNREELLSKAEKGRIFIRENKNEKASAEKIISLISGIKDGAR